MTTSREDYSEFWPIARIHSWEYRIPPNPSLARLIDEAVGHAICLRDQVFDQPEDVEATRDRALQLMKVLLMLQEAEAGVTDDGLNDA
jgi:hypothetical protein